MPINENPNPIAQDEGGYTLSTNPGSQDEAPPSYTNEQAQYRNLGAGVWDDCRIINRFEDDSCKYMLGITSANRYRGKTASVCQLAIPTLLWISDWTVSRKGNPPSIPNPQSQDPNWELMDAISEANETQLLGDGVSKSYRISGTYIYASTDRAFNLTDYLVFPIPPWLNSTDARRITSSYVLDDLLSDNFSAYSLSTGSP
jgi:hypothetical protein